MAPTRLPAGAVVRVDGVLDEPAWEDAARLGPLVATEPVEGATPAQPTEVRLAYDHDFLYVALLCFDDPGEVRARQRDRDANVQFDDVVELWFDTFDDQRSAFWFQITPAGSRGDALLADGGDSFNKSWDGIWYGRARVTDRGWQAELAFPFKTLAFRADHPTWGFNLERRRVANGEEARWANPRVAYRFFNLAEGGALTGMTGMHQGYGVDVVPYAKAAVGRDHQQDGDLEDDYDVGLDVSWRPTPATNLRLTFNTDFAETEVDDRQVNLTRFPLFFPEKRDFFLEDAGVFEFGPSGFGNGNRVRPFFSRTIGRDSEGQAVPILAGAKFTGRLGDWTVGALGTRLDAHEDAGAELSEQDLAVVRVARNLGGRSSVGVIATGGRPDADLDATTAGVDFRLGSSRFFGDGHTADLWGWYLTTDNEGEPDGDAWGLRAQTRSSRWEHRVEASTIEEGYDPKLGFVRRSGVDQYSYSAEYTWRANGNGGLRRWSTGAGIEYDEDRVGREDALEVPVNWLEVELPSQDQIQVQSRYLEERLEEGFELPGDVFVQPDEYEMVRHSIEFEGNDRRKLLGEVEIEWGDFFSGDIFSWRVAPVVVPSALFTWRLSYEEIQGDLDEGSFTTQIIANDFDFSFNPDLSWKNVVQYDTESEELGWQSRLHWIVEPGHDLYLVGLFGWDRFERDSFRRTGEELTLKVSYTFRF